MLSIHTLLIAISNTSVFDLLVFSVSHVENYDVYACIIVMVQCRGNEPFAKLFKMINFKGARWGPTVQNIPVTSLLMTISELV